MIDFKIKSLEFSSGDNIELEEHSLLLLVGPNNGGKSTVLRDIEHHLINPQHNEPIAIQQVVTEKDGTFEEFQEWLATHFPFIERKELTKYYTKGQAITSANLRNIWNNPNQAIHFFCHRLTTEERLQIVKPKPKIRVFQDSLSEYIHVLQADENLLETISQEVRAAFDKELLINWGGGGQIWFHVGDKIVISEGNDRVSSTYLKKLNKLPLLEEDGDGIKSFVGCLMGIYCGAHKILLIDEPEAFLHPSQARRLGYLLAQSAEKLKRQVIVATHSSDIIKGAINSSYKIAVCRIERNNQSNNAYLLKSERLEEFWSKPLLQSTSAIHGIFHKGAVVCEADADCRFYESILNRLQNKNVLDKPADIYFVSGGGKGELATLVRSYKALNIPTVAIADFDLLQKESELKQVFEAFGADFSEVQASYNSAKSALNDLPRIKTIPVFVNEMESILNEISNTGDITKVHKEKISDLLSDSSKWSEAKKYGINKLAGGAYNNCLDVLNKCQKIGLFLVPQGELESWWRGGATTKKLWILDALKQIQTEPNNFEEAEKFVIDICRFLGIVKRT